MSGFIDLTDNRYGRLCRKCNSLLGFADDNLLNAAKYLNIFKKRGE